MRKHQAWLRCFLGGRFTMPNEPKRKKEQTAGTVQEKTSVQVKSFDPEHAGQIRKVLSDAGFTMTEDEPNTIVGVGDCCLDGAAREHLKNAIAIASNDHCEIEVKGITKPT